MAFANERNTAIYEHRVQDKWALAKLAKEYGLSVSRVDQIVKKMECVRSFDKPVREDDAWDVYRYAVSRYCDVPKETVVRAINCLARDLVRSNKPIKFRNDHAEFKSVLKGLTYEGCLKMRNCGIKSAELLMRIKAEEGC